MSTAHIQVSAVAAGFWRVDVDAGASTSHEVTIPTGYLEKLGVRSATPERVLEASFQFLLEREPNTSILTRFELSVIARYFPEYEREISRRVDG